MVAGQDTNLLAQLVNAMTSGSIGNEGTGVIPS